MKTLIRIVSIGAVACTQHLALPQSSAPGKAVLRTAPTPTPTPTPKILQPTAPVGVATPISPKTNPALAPPTITGPQYSPTQLDFGSLWDGESARRTVTLTPPMDGVVTVSFPGGGGFWVAEYRVFGPPSGSKNDGMRQNGPISQWQLKSRTKYAAGKSIPGYYPQIVAAGDQIQVDIVFQPVSQSKESISTLAVPPGTQSIEITIVGPGSTKFWSVKISARGVFNGSK